MERKGGAQELHGKRRPTESVCKKEPAPVLPLGPKGSQTGVTRWTVRLKSPTATTLWYLGSGPYKDGTGASAMPRRLMD